MGDDIVPGKDCFSSVFMVVGGEMHKRDDNGKGGSRPVQKPGCCVIHVDDEATKCNRDRDGEEDRVRCSSLP